MKLINILLRYVSCHNVLFFHHSNLIISRHQAPPAWRSKAPPFRVLVHSPTKVTTTLSGSYTVYAVTSLFRSDGNSHTRFISSSSTSSVATDTGSRSHTPTPSHSQVDLPVSSEQEEIHVTVYRRFSHFVFLHTALSRRLPGIALPPLPEKQYAGRFSNDFVEARRGDLERWISRVARHPLVRYSEVLVFFLSCDNELVRAYPFIHHEAYAEYFLLQLFLPP